jgi:hypothetical protein
MSKGKLFPIDVREGTPGEWKQTGKIPKWDTKKRHMRYMPLHQVTLTVKAACMSCSAEMQYEWHGDPPYIMVCTACGASHLVEVGGYE